MAFTDAVKNRAIDLCNNGNSAAKALEALEKEFPSGTELPDERTIRRWHKEKPLISIKKEQERIRSYVPENWREHFEKLAGVATLLLANDLDRVQESSRGTNASNEPTDHYKEKYIVFRSVDDFYRMTDDDLSYQLEQNLESVLDEYKQWFYAQCFLPHLESELPEKMQGKDYSKLINEQPFQLIEILRILSARKTFKGTCPVCRDWG